MNRNFTIIIAFVLTLFGTQLTAMAQTEAELQEKFTAFLDERNLFSKVDSDGDVQFQLDGKTYFIDVEENDPLYFRVVLANIWPIDSEDERRQVLRAVDIANSKIKVAKIYTVDDNIWVGVEGFMSDPDGYEVYFDRCINVIEGCIEHFRDALNE